MIPGDDVDVFIDIGMCTNLHNLHFVLPNAGMNSNGCIPIMLVCDHQRIILVK